MQLSLGEITVEVVLKNIENIHLSVYPPTGGCAAPAPARMELEAIRLFALSKLGWIRAQQRKIQAQPREPAREYIERESHYVWGERYLLEVTSTQKHRMVELSHKALRCG
jgi:predicted metal-dependent hydrolase